MPCRSDQRTAPRSCTVTPSDSSSSRHEKCREACWRCRPMRALVVVLFAFLSLPAAAQTAEQVLATSPQLLAFAGSDANLQALVNGLTNGQTVTLVTQDASGVLQIVTFTPPSALEIGRAHV